MSESNIQALENQLKHLIGKDYPEQAVHEIHAAMALAGILEAKGFSFTLKDLCPQSMNETAWGASFIKDGMQFSANDAQSSVAVCKAALGALTTPLPEDDA